MEGFRAYHDSAELRCREPFGAMEAGSEVILRLFVAGPGAEKVHAVLRTWNGREKYHEGVSFWEGNARVFEYLVRVPDEPCVLWYHFRLHYGSGFCCVGAKDALLRSGESETVPNMPHDFRITVFEKGFRTPESFWGRTVYQIFPDRFSRSGRDVTEAIGHHRRFGRRVTVKEWCEEVDYLPRGGEIYYSPQDYYLGDLRGIMGKIPYLKSLGVGAVYLNPIFESAYNHRYSISDHMKLDPLLGDEEDLRALIDALHGADIKLILDGVFSHTGDDSVYFDRYGNYGGGAWSDPRSPYREWYDFDPKYKHGFRCWWDFETLPEVEELTPSYMDHIAAVLEKWTRLGADGWRLDVADELPDEFIKFLRRKLKALSPEALLIGEVWEDAALKKDGFGKRREYVNGAELDGVMDYPFSDAVLDFLLGKIDAGRLASLLISQLEGYPKCFMRTQLGLLGSHDMPRVLSILSGAPEKDSVPREAQAAWRATEEGEKLGKKRLMQASALQFSMPFMPCVYYGDEAGLHGLSDPFCRRPFPWGHEDAELTAHYRRLAELREQCPELKEGAAAFAHCGRDVFAIARLGEREVFTVVNRADTEADILLSAADFRGEARPKEGELRFEGVPAHGFKVFIR